MTNMFDMRCPKCDDTERIDIQARLWIRVTEHGTDADASENGDHEWTPDSPALCVACGHCGQVRDFDPEGATES